MNSFQNPKFNPQARFSAVAEAVALADAEDRGETSNSQSITQYQNVVRRRPAPSSSRPLSTFLTDSVDAANHPNTHHNGLLENNPIPKRKPRPASMAVIPPIETAPECFYCLGEGTHLCNWCRAVYYCGPSHYNIHRCHSKCWPFKVKGLSCQERARII